MDDRQQKKRERLGLLYGLLGVLGFSMTLPASRFAVGYFGATMVGPGRAVVAAVLALLVLVVRKEKRPTREAWRGLVVVAFGAILAFPYLSAWAMGHLPAAHGAVILALLPLATAGVATLRNGERPSKGYWIASIIGCLAVLAYAIGSGFGGLQPADLALILAVLILAFAYAEGGRLAGVLGGWQVIAWALVLAGPFLLLPVWLSLPPHIFSAPPTAWLSFGYLAIGSQFVAFVCWYTGFDFGGVARVSQLQYLQPFFTILFAVLFLSESVSLLTVVSSLVVVVTVFFGKKAVIQRTPAPSDQDSLPKGG